MPDRDLMRGVLRIGAGLLLAAVLVDLRPWTWSWTWPAGFLRGHPALLLGAAALAVLLGSSVSLHRSRPRHAEDRQGLRWPWLLSNAGISVAFLSVVLLGLTALVAMLWLGASSPEPERVKLQIEAIKWSLGIIAAGGAGAALLLNARRQQLAEHNYQLELKKQAHTEADAAHRRVTDLYAKSVEQLGSADAAVRLGGVYALERVAQGSPEQRQTCVDVLCAYLRMPYTAPGRKAPAVANFADLPLPGPVTPIPSRDAHQELQVRLTAQRVLARHLRPFAAGSEPPAAESGYWPGTAVDLRGATLVDLDLTSAVMASGTFTTASFVGHADFAGCEFQELADFEHARFDEDVDFRRATFRGTAQFSRGEYAGALFDGARFIQTANFSGVKVAEYASFRDVIFSGAAVFSGAHLSEAEFSNSVLGVRARFAKTEFFGRADFENVTFRGLAPLATAVFHDELALHRARVDPWEGRPGNWPGRWTVVADPGRPGVGVLVPRP